MGDRAFRALPTVPAKRVPTGVWALTDSTGGWQRRRLSVRTSPQLERPREREIGRPLFFFSEKAMGDPRKSAHIIKGCLLRPGSAALRSSDGYTVPNFPGHSKQCARRFAHVSQSVCYRWRLSIVPDSLTDAVLAYWLSMELLPPENLAKDVPELPIFQRYLSTLRFVFILVTKPQTNSR